MAKITETLSYPPGTDVERVATYVTGLVAKAKATWPDATIEAKHLGPLGWTITIGVKGKSFFLDVVDAPEKHAILVSLDVNGPLMAMVVPTLQRKIKEAWKAALAAP